jgi:hypothetical protein
MRSFSERKGYKEVSDVIQTESMSTELRNSVWNILDTFIWSIDGFMYSRMNNEAGIHHFSRSLWMNSFKKPIDTLQDKSVEDILLGIRNYFFECKWFEVYDFLEFVLSIDHCVSMPDLARIFNNKLEEELSGYRIVDGRVTDITNKQEIEMLEEALKDDQFSGVQTHLKSAFQLYSDRENPDYRNSIKESISAVESIAIVIADNPKANLHDALEAIKRKGNLHPILKKGFSCLYSYTSSSDSGIRHAMLDDQTEITQADAKYFLMSCTAFINYLKSKM